MPKPFSKEFRADVFAVARQGDQSIAQVTRSFGLSECCLARWRKIADRDEGRTGASPAGAAEGENRELRKRAKRLEQENEILRRATAYFARDVLPQRCSRWSLTSRTTTSTSR